MHYILFFLKDHIRCIYDMLVFRYKLVVVSVRTMIKYPEDEFKADMVKVRWTTMVNYKILLDTRNVLRERGEERRKLYQEVPYAQPANAGN